MLLPVDIQPLFLILVSLMVPVSVTSWIKGCFASYLERPKISQVMRKTPGIHRAVWRAQGRDFHIQQIPTLPSP